MVLIGCAEDSVMTSSEQCSGKIVLPGSNFSAGDEIELFITTDTRCRQILKLGISDFWGENIFPVKDLRFIIPDVISKRKGIKTITLYSDNIILDNVKIQISAVEATGILESYFGPKTIPSDKDLQFMFITIPRDKYNNPIADGSEVEYQLMYPDQLHSEVKKTKNLITYKSVNTDHPSGKIYAGMSTSGSHSRETEVYITEGWPTSFDIDIMQYYPFADSRQFFYVESDRITDTAGNVIKDGTMVYFNLYENNSLIGKYKAYSINGKATVKVQNPDKSIDLEVEASIGHISKSNRKKISFKSAVSDYDLSWNTHQKKIIVGPVIGYLDQLIADGFNFEFQIRGNETNITRKSEINNGRFEYDLNNLILQKGEYLFITNISGLQKSIKFKIT